MRTSSRPRSRGSRSPSATSCSLRRPLGHPPQLSLRSAQGYAISALSRSVDRASLSVSNNIADAARQRGDGLGRRHWPGAQRRAACAGRPPGGAGRNGFERGTTNELLALIYIARGSAARGALDALLLRAPARARGFQISNLRFEISCRELLPATARLGRLAPEFRHPGPAAPERPGARDYQKREARESGAAAFHELLQQNLPPDHPLRHAKP